MFGYLRFVRAFAGKSVISVSEQEFCIWGAAGVRNRLSVPIAPEKVLFVRRG